MTLYTMSAIDVPQFEKQIDTIPIETVLPMSSEVINSLFEERQKENSTKLLPIYNFMDAHLIDETNPYIKKEMSPSLTDPYSFIDYPCKTTIVKGVNNHAQIKNTHILNAQLKEYQNTRELQVPKATPIILKQLGGN